MRWYPDEKKPENAGEAMRVIESAFAPADGGRVDLDMVGRGWHVSRAERMKVAMGGAVQAGFDDMRTQVEDALEAAGFVIHRRVPARLPRAELVEPVPALPGQDQPAGGQEGEQTRVIDSSAAGSSSGEKRRDKRVDWPVSFRLRLIDTSGRLVGEEMTIAENTSPSGARVMTSFSWLSVGDVVQIEEWDKPFRRAWAEVRGKYVGRDGVSRLNLSFVSPFSSRPAPYA